MLPLAPCPLPLPSPDPLPPRAGNFDRSIASKSDLLILIKSGLGGGAWTGLTGGSSGGGMGGVIVLFCSLVTGVCVSLFSAEDADSASASSEKVLRPPVPATGPPERMLRLNIARMMMTSSNIATAKPMLRRRRSSRLQSVCSE